MDSALNHCSVGAAYMPPAALPLPPRIFCIVARGLDRLTAHKERRQPAKLARSCGCLPCRGKHCSLPDFAPLNRGPTLTTPHLRGTSRTQPPTTAIRKPFHNRKRARRPEGRPPYVLPLTEFAGKNSSLPPGPYPNITNKKGRADDPSSARPFVFIPIYACRNRLRNSTVFAFCGCSKMSAGVPSSQMTPSAM